ncbi:glycosyltransferase [Mesorhizobium shangrilense]|uniref:Glycosyltransferase n=1 Tax=Mesorhizobium shangrilense TaxID=460060 RepID=A0ABV2D5T8_9HYPH
MNYFEGRSLTHDWTSFHLEVWESLLRDKVHSATEVLEVGSFEGRSALFFLQFLPKSRIICVDTFEGGIEHITAGSEHAADMADVEARFDHNMKPFAARVDRRKGASIDVLPQLRTEERVFDIVYIDGDHRAASVFADASLCWTLLDHAGVMILDDYRWKLDYPVTERPAAGIDAFLQEIDGDFDLLHKGEQVIIRKKLPAAASGITLGGRGIDGLAGGALVAPLVSFVVIAWNYGRYVGATIDSIRKQDYPHFECIVIDNGSTDDSAEVIARHIDGDSRFRLETLPQNHGQLGAALWALDKIKGGFVSFIDADDVLFENYASTHIQVHMALPRSVAFTSANVAEMDVDGNALSSSYLHHKLERKDAVRGLRPAQTVLRLPTISASTYRFLADNTASVPRWQQGWFWAPGTANMFRASVLRLVMLGDGSKPYMHPADGYFNVVSHAFAGSALVNVPLSGYRLHPSNYYAVSESIDGLRGGTAAFAKKSRDFTYETIDLLLRECERYAWAIGTDFWSVLDQVTRQERQMLRPYFADERAFQLFMHHAPKLVAVFGRRVFRRQVVARFSGCQARAILRAGLGRLTLCDHWKIISSRHRIRRSKQK